MPTDADIGNMALSRLGTRATIASLTENSAEARALNTWYATIRDDLLRAADWNFNRVYLDLAESGTPPVRWYYSYAYPSDALKIWGFDFGLPSYMQTIPPLYEVASDGTNRLIYTNMSPATAVYCQRVTDPNRMDSTFVTAFAVALAAAVAMPITQKVEVSARLTAQAKELFETAVAQSANEQMTAERFREAETLNVRGTQTDALFIDGALVRPF